MTNSSNARNATLGELATLTASELVQRIGHVGIFYRRGKDLAKIVIPDK